MSFLEGAQWSRSPQKTSLEAAQAELLSVGFAPCTLVQLSAEEMAAQVKAELADVNPLANFGYERDVVRVHGDLAQRGCSFWAIEVPNNALCALVAQNGSRLQACIGAVRSPKAWPR
ncbi:hypothetical protein [Rhodoferax aquaticus]|uniref:Uncharacterized protein n=1 Tax=Rhodoferax aquaticus TaxID=2527691 RepID=A0A515ET82_9BURK|nr:hypothetical protein [Rhodoferax aquaticus]QDL55887.1 hypothetical protein EXZ61_17850 [Rhodoferax aquaticus]